MKKIFILLFSITFFLSCGDDEDDDYQDYTSFVVINKSASANFNNVVAGYKKDDKFIKIADLGTVRAETQSGEIILDREINYPIYLFADYFGTIRIDKEFILKKNTKNVFTISGNTETISVINKNDPFQYPQKDEN